MLYSKKPPTDGDSLLSGPLEGVVRGIGEGRKVSGMNSRLASGLNSL